MRIVIIVACAAAFVFSAWANLPSTADARSDISIDPATLTTVTTNLPAQYFDAF
jgi:hypothetical protein